MPNKNIDIEIKVINDKPFKLYGLDYCEGEIRIRNTEKNSLFQLIGGV